MRALFPFFLTLFLSNLSYALDFQILHTKPECNHPGKTTAWCTIEDVDRIEKNSGMVAKINSLIDLADSPESKITIAYLSFSNKGVFDKLCEMGRKGIRIEGFFDTDYSGPEKLPTSLRDKCQGPSQNNVRVRFLGEKKNDEEGNLLVWRLHHDKFLMVDPGKGRDVSLSFSSGNLSQFGTSLHFDHWVTTMAPPDSQLVKSHNCVIRGLKSAVDNSSNEKDDPSLYIQEFKKCSNEAGLNNYTALENDGIYLLNAPNDGGEVEKGLLAEVRRIGKAAMDSPKEKFTIKGAIQHFKHYRIANELKKLCSRTKGKVSVSLIMDDDVVRGESEVPDVSEFFMENLKNIKNGGNSCIDITFLQTNSEIKQMMHNKFLTFNGPNYHRSFSGAGHFTTSAMRYNYENFYISDRKGLVDQYNDLFDYMYKVSLSYEDSLLDY